MATSARRKFAIALVTAPNLAVARKLARAAVRARLAACANLVPKIESHYWWRGKVETATEILVILKTTRARLPALERLIVAEHPYDTPNSSAYPSGGATKGTWRGWRIRCVSGTGHGPTLASK